MKPEEIVREYYDPAGKAFRVLIDHGRRVADRALEVARRLGRSDLDLDFIHEAAVLHDIAIFMTDTPELGCSGRHPYVCHGYLGRELLEARGLPRHALVCERHVGVGISLGDIRRQRLPLPQRDMLPISLEEQIICYADKFFSKNGQAGNGRHSTEDIMAGLARYGPEKVDRFRRWMARFDEGA